MIDIGRTESFWDPDLQCKISQWFASGESAHLPRFVTFPAPSGLMSRLNRRVRHHLASKARRWRAMSLHNNYGVERLRRCISPYPLPLPLSTISDRKMVSNGRLQWCPPCVYIQIWRSRQQQWFYDGFLLCNGWQHPGKETRGQSLWTKFPDNATKRVRAKRSKPNVSGATTPLLSSAYATVDFQYSFATHGSMPLPLVSVLVLIHCGVELMNYLSSIAHHLSKPYSSLGVKGC